MANKWYYKGKDDKKYGPFSDQKLKKLAQDGLLEQDALIWKEGMDTWRHAGAIKGLFPQTASTSHAGETIGRPTGEAATVAEFGKQEKKDTSFFEQAKESATRISSYAKKQAQLKMLEFKDIPAKEYELGLTLFKERFGIEQSYRDIFAEIESIDSQVKVLRSENAGEQADTVSDRMKKAGAKAINIAKAEAMLISRKNLLTTLGQKAVDDNPSGLSKEACHLLSDLHAAIANRDRIRAEIEALGKMRTSFGSIKTIGKAAMGLGVLAIVITVARAYTTSIYRAAFTSSTESSVSKILSELETERAQAAAKANQIQKEISDRRITDEKRQLLKEAELKLQQQEERLRREILAQKAKQEQEAIEQQEMKKAAMLAEQERINHELNRKQAEIESAAAHVSEQAIRESHAMKLISGIDLNPNTAIQLSRSFKNAGAKLELRGAKHEGLVEYKNSKRWLSFLNLLGDTNYSEYPSTQQIDKIVEECFSQRNSLFGRSVLFVLVRTNDKILNNNYSVGLLPLKSTGVIRPQDMNTVTEPHPDGIGYTFQWNPLAGPHLLFNCDWTNEAFFEHKKAYSNLDETLENLRTKLELGEIDSVFEQRKREAAVLELHNKLRSWAERQ